LERFHSAGLASDLQKAKTDSHFVIFSTVKDMEIKEGFFMVSRPIILLALLSMMMSSGCIISGKIVDENGVGVAGVTVTLNGDQVRTTVTDSEGNYRFGDFAIKDLIPAGAYIVTPTKPGCDFTTASRNVEIIAQALGDLENFTWPVSCVDFEIDDGSYGQSPSPGFPSLDDWMEFPNLDDWLEFPGPDEWV
jgi:hypothetical protein